MVAMLDLTNVFQLVTRPVDVWDRVIPFSEVEAANAKPQSSVEE